jgi:hypothetical protein
MEACPGIFVPMTQYRKIIAALSRLSLKTLCWQSGETHKGLERIQLRFLSVHAQTEDKMDAFERWNSLKQKAIAHKTKGEL